MRLRSITFRCSDTQHERLQLAMQTQQQDNRTEIISRALEEFLDFSNQENIQKLDLFALVDLIDDLDKGHPFATES